MKTLMHFFWILLAVVSLTACQQDRAPVEGFDDQSSRDLPPGVLPGPSPSTGTYVVTEYNRIQTDSEDYRGLLEGKVKTYYSQIGQYRADMVRVRLNDMPFEMDKGNFVKFYRGKVRNGVLTLDTKALSLVIESGSTETPLSGSIKDISKNTLAQMNPPIAPANIINYNIVISGTTTDYEVIQAVLYDPEGEPLVPDSETSFDPVVATFLIPAFRVNPNDYAAQHPDETLKRLHPFWEDRSNFDTPGFLGIAESYRF